MISDLIGKGSYAHVYQAHLKVMQKSKSTAFNSTFDENSSQIQFESMWVAIKVYDFSSKRHKNIKTEIQVLKLCDHPNIIKIKEAIESPNKMNIVLEYADGISLLKYLKTKTKLPE